MGRTVVNHVKVAPLLNSVSKLAASLASIEETTTLIIVGLFVNELPVMISCGIWSTGEPSHF